MRHAWMGPTGSLRAFECPSDVDVAGARAGSSVTTLGGRVMAQYGRSMHRSWQVQVSVASPSEAASLAALVHGGGFPWEFHHPGAVATNMLTPSQSLLAEGTVQETATTGGRRVAVDGVVSERTMNVAASSSAYLGLTDGSANRGMPVSAGIPVTASVYAARAVLRLIFRDAAGSWITTESSSLAGAAFERVTVTATAPAGAVDALMQIVTTSQGAGVAGNPAYTFTTAPTPWGVGAGCVSAIVLGLDESLLVAHQGQQLSSYSFTVQEVGAGA